MLSIAVAICWRGGCLPQCMLGYTPSTLGLGLGVDTPLPRAWAWTPPFPPGPVLGQPPPPGQTPPGLILDSLPVDRMTDRCKNITFPLLRLRTVITSKLRQKATNKAPLNHLRNPGSARIRGMKLEKQIPQKRYHFYRPQGKVVFSQVSVYNRPHGYWFTARPCYSAVGTHPTGMRSCYKGV